MKYKIGDVARMLGISSDLLRYYEKKGIVHPQKDSNNDYRYYEPWDINFLLDCLWYKNFDFSMDDIAFIVSGCDYDELKDTLACKEAEIEANIRKQELILARLRQHEHEMSRVEKYLGKCDIVTSVPVYSYINRHNFAYDVDPVQTALSQAWLKYMPFVHRCFEIQLDDLPGRDGSGNYSWGMSIEQKYVDQFPILHEPPVRFLESRECVHSVFKSSGKDAFSTDKIKYIVDYANDNGYTIIGNAHGNLLCSVLENDMQTGYFEVWIPIDLGLNF